MKTLCTILFITSALLMSYKKPLVSTTYYVDNSRPNDSGDGLSPATAWKTIAKVNGFSFAATDVILFKAGETWNEKLTVNRSDISFGRYGTGANPVFTGLKALTGWTSIGSNKWTATASSSVTLQNTVIIDGVMRGKARYPNSYWLNANGAAGQQTIIWGPSGIPDFTGAEIVFRVAHWIINTSKVTSQVGDTIYFSPRTNYLMSESFLGTNGYFVQNLPAYVDTVGEWSIDSTSKLVTIYSVGSPTDVKYSNIDTLVNINSKVNISFNGIDITGANQVGIALWACRNVSITNCNITQMGQRGIRSASSPHTTVTNCVIKDVHEVGFDAEEGYGIVGSDTSVVSDNLIKNVALYPGMVRSFRQSAIAALIKFGTGTRFTRNRIDSIGYSGLFITSNKALVDSNYITNFCLTRDDGGGIYTVMSGFPLGMSQGQVFRGNVIVNGIGVAVAPLTGMYTSGVASAGIYLDNTTVGVKVEGNTIINCNEQSVEMGWPHNDTLINNTIVSGRGVGLTVFGDQDTVHGMWVKNNIFLNYNNYPNVRRSLHGGNMQNMDSNFYLQPKAYKPSQPFYRANAIDSVVGYGHTLHEWITATGQDLHSSLIPETVVGTDPFLVHYNPTFSDSTIALTGSWVDVRGTVYNGSITLHPFTSVVLFKHYNRSIQLLTY